MKQIKIMVVFSILLTVAACAKEPHPGALYQKVYPKDLTSTSQIIKPHKIKFEKPGGFITYDLQKIQRNGKEVYRLYVYYNVDENEAPDIMYFDINTIGYLGRTLGTGKDNKYLIDIDFDENYHLTGSLTPQNNSGYKPRTYDKQYSHGVFEPAVINYAISALPLTIGYKASIPTIDLNDGSHMVWANIEVLKKETITVGEKEYETWKVKSNGVKEKTIWVSTTEPYAVKMITDGSFGAWMIK